MKIKTLLFFASLFLLQPIFSQQLNVAKLDSLFNLLEKKDKFLGSVSISQNGKNIYSRSIYKKEGSQNKSTNPQSKYRIGSISKMFTACLVLKACEENKLSLAQNINSFFPNVINAEKINVENLLNHRSGIHNLTSNEDYLSYYTQAHTQAQMLGIIEKGKSDFEPGSKFEYSNSNYILLSMMLEKIYKKPFREILNEKILKPAGLKNTYYGGKIDPKQNECYSYGFSDSWVQEKETDMSIPMGAGALVSNPADLVFFIEQLFNGRIVSDNSLKLMLDTRDGYGLGIRHQPMFGKDSYGHSGGIDNFTSALYHFPESKLTIAITSNGCIYNTKAILKAAAASFFGVPFELPNFETLELKPEELDTYVGQYANTSLPLEINITRAGNKLQAQSPGQPMITLDATKKDMFEFQAAGIKLEFKPEQKLALLHQGGQTFELTKK